MHENAATPPMVRPSWTYPFSPLSSFSLLYGAVFAPFLSHRCPLAWLAARGRTHFKSPYPCGQGSPLSEHVVLSGRAADWMEPPHSFSVSKRRDKLTMRIHLHRVPEKFVQVDVTAQRIKVDTPGWTKKFLVECVRPFARFVRMGHSDVCRPLVTQEAHSG